MAQHPQPPRIADYEYVKFLGAGGFGDVFQYRQVRTGGSVAVKVLRDGAISQAGREQFQREAQALGRLATEGAHPNIVAVHLVDEVDGRPYLVMEYCPNGSLAQKVRGLRAGMDPNEVMRLGIQVAGALHMAHEAGIVHRDIKPGNILFGLGDIPKLSDFGIAALTAEEVAGGSAFLSKDYAAYEVIERGQSDELADVFSLAATLYEALAGHSWAFEPGGDNSDRATQRRLADGEVKPIKGAPPRLDRVIRAAMSRDRGLRLRHAPDAGALARDLQTVQLELQYQVTPVPIYRDAAPPLERPQQPASATSHALHPGAAGEPPTGWAHQPAGPPLTGTIARSPLPPPSLPGEPKQRKSKRWIAVAAAVATLALVGGVAWLRPSTPATSPTATLPADPGDGALPVVRVPTPIVKGERLDADTVRFAWTYPDPLAGDYFTVQRADNSATAQVDKAEWTADGITERLCVKVRLIRADRRAGQETGEACA